MISKTQTEFFVIFFKKIMYFEESSDELETIKILKFLNRFGIYDMVRYLINSYNDSNIHIFTQIARMFLFKPLFKFNVVDSFKMVPFADSILSYIYKNNYNNYLVSSVQKNIYSSVTDVHSDNRDQKIYAGLQRLFKIWNPTPEQIEFNFNEFWQKSKELTGDRLKKFTTIMGYTHDMEKIKHYHVGEDGKHNFSPLLHSSKVTKYNYNPKEIIARLWEFGKDFPTERLHDALIESICASYQNHIVCDNGKIQNMCVYVLGGRMLMEDGSIFSIEDEDVFERLSRQNKELLSSKENHIDIYHIIKPFLDSFAFNRPKNANDFFKKLFFYIMTNKIQIDLSKIIETVCLFAETKDGFIKNHDLSIANNFEDMFDISEYKTLEYQIEFQGENLYPNLDYTHLYPNILQRTNYQQNEENGLSILVNNNNYKTNCAFLIGSFDNNEVLKPKTYVKMYIDKEYFHKITKNYLLVINNAMNSFFHDIDWTKQNTDFDGDELTFTPFTIHDDNKNQEKIVKSNNKNQEKILKNNNKNKRKNLYNNTKQHNNKIKSKKNRNNFKFLK